MTVNIAIVGVGWAGTRHIEAINELAAHYEANGDDAPVRVVMLVDPDKDHLAEVASRFGIEKTSTSLEEALGDSKIDAVSIATPHANHVDAAVAAAQAGKHIAVEKPIAVTVEEADQMIDVANRMGVKLFVTEQVAYSSEVAQLREIVEAQEHIGEPTFATVTAGFRAKNYGYAGRRDWLALPDKGGSGTWLLHGVHTVAALRAVFGEVISVYAVQSSTSSFERDDIEGTMTCLLQMKSGLNIQLAQSCETDFAPERLGTTVFGTEGTFFSGKNGISVQSKDSDVPLHIDHPAQELSDYALEFQAFANWITQGQKPPTTGRHERGSLAVIQAGYESAADGQPVDLTERFGKAP